MKLPITAIILTYNEERNIEDGLKSIVDFIDEIWIVDSYSTDSTLDLVKKYTSNIVQHPFGNYSLQRNWAFNNLEIKNEWLLVMDSDHRMTPELKDLLIDKFSREIPSDLMGYMVSRKTMFMNKWIKHGGHYPTYHAALFRKGAGRCEEKNYDQHFIVTGRTEILKGDIIDIITDSLTTFTTRHNTWATLEAEEAVRELSNEGALIKPDKNGNPIEQRRYMKMKYYRYPIFLRVAIYFIYRYIFKFGFLDGKEGLIFHVLQGLWFRFLVDSTPLLLP